MIFCDFYIIQFLTLRYIYTFDFHIVVGSSVAPNKDPLESILLFYSDISRIRYNIQLTRIGQSVNLLQQRQAHKNHHRQHFLEPFLLACHTLDQQSQIFYFAVNLQRTGACRKSWRRQFMVNHKVALHHLLQHIVSLTT